MTALSWRKYVAPTLSADYRNNHVPRWSRSGLAEQKRPFATAYGQLTEVDLTVTSAEAMIYVSVSNGLLGLYSPSN
jgi:hypothetical protein